MKEKKRLLFEKINQIFLSRKQTFVFLALFVSIILIMVQFLVILIMNGFYMNYSDDLLQYYPIINDFITQVKNGTISWFNLNNYLGASFFSDVYYVPLDIFTFITYLLSYLMPTEIAYSSTELIKVFAGVMMFAYYLSLKKMNNRTIFWMSIIYFISGGSVSFMAFPVFLSMAFYLPLSLVMIHFYLHKIKWTVPLFALMIIFYDFYLGYMVLAFTSVMYIVEHLKEFKFNLKKFLIDGITFLGLLILGVLMSMVILYPSMLFILNDTYRHVSEFGESNSWVITIWDYSVQLFKPDLYIRFLAKIFAEQKSISFYGFLNDYRLEHVSFYITIIGFVYMTYIYAMKDRIARIYKILIPIGIILMIFPISSFVFSGTTDWPYTRWLNFYPLIEIIILAHVFNTYGFEKVKMKYLSIPIVLLLALDSWLVYYYINKLTSDAYLISSDVLTADTVLMGISGLVLILLMIFGWLKKFKVVKVIFWVEFAIAIGFIYSTSFAGFNKIDTFNTMDDIDTYLNTVLDDDEFYRVYVDVSRFDVEAVNFNRMTTLPTNTRIFHSWTDSETNTLSRLILYNLNQDNSEEYQTKNLLEQQALYLNQFLGYKYILVNAAFTYYMPETYYTLIDSNDTYALYEINDAQPFSVYESYTTMTTFAQLSSVIARQSILVSDVIINMDDERFDLSDINLEEADIRNDLSMNSIYPYYTTQYADEVIMSSLEDSSVLKTYYEYSKEELDLQITAGAIYIKIDYFDVEDYGEVFMTYEDGTKKACEVQTDKPQQVKCEFFQEPTALYFEKTDGFNAAQYIKYRIELAYSGDAYLSYNLAYMPELTDNDLVYFYLKYNTDLERVFVTDEEGNQYELFKGYGILNFQPSRIYILKTSDLYDEEKYYSTEGDYSLFSLRLRYVIDDLTYYQDAMDSTPATDQEMTIENGTIHLSYDRTTATTYDQVIVIPVAYSEEWVITSGQDYETFSSNGGFLSIIVPYGTYHIDITIKFQPNGLKEGAVVSMLSFVTYLAIFSPVIVKSIYNISKKEGSRYEEDYNHHSIL